VTLKDIAGLANTSISTVSRSLNDSDLVAEETKQRIKAIADAYGFEFNAMARGLVTSTVATIGVILPENFDRFDVQLYHATLHNDFRKTLEQADLDMIVAFKENRFTGGDNINKLVTRKKVDGLIIVQEGLDAETIAYLNSRQVPFVLTQYPPAEAAPPYDVIYSDNPTGGTLVAEHMLERGFRRIVCITGGAERESAQRLEGFRAALAGGGVQLEEEDILEGNYQSSHAAELVLANLDRVRRADALFALSDLMAFGALEALQASGVRVPDDLALVGYDDTPLVAATIPGITSVHQAREEIALLAIELLLDLITRKSEGTLTERAPRAIAIQPRLVIRESTGAVPEERGRIL